MYGSSELNLWYVLNSPPPLLTPHTLQLEHPLGATISLLFLYFKTVLLTLVNSINIVFPGAGLGAALQGVSTLLLGGALAAAYSWKMTAASLVALPLVSTHSFT